MDEFELIRRFFARRCTHPDVLLGIGDDGAIVRPTADRDLVIAIDTLVEGVHFPSEMNPADIAYRAVAVNLSDLAAMASRPRWMTLALTLAEADADWLQGFSGGLFEAAAEHDLVLIGGDTTRGSEIVISVQVTGDVLPGCALRRSGARIGDDIYVTGTVGDAAAGLALWRADSVRDENEQYLRLRFARPTARVAFASALAPHASAAIDLSDGLYADIGKLLLASRCGASMEVENLPLSAALLAVRGEESAIDLALCGGDDYEIAFTAPPSAAAAIAELAAGYTLRVTRIGAVTSGNGLRCLRAGQTLPFVNPGYRHFGDDHA